MGKLPVLIRDTREHEGQGWKWNKTLEIEGTIERKIDYGDYSIEGMESFAVVERKGSASELITNLFSKDKERFIRELENLSKIKHAWIICEFTLDDVAEEIAKIANIKWYKKKQVAFITMKKFLGFISSLNIRYNVQFIFAGKNYARELCKRLLLKAHKHDGNN